MARMVLVVDDNFIERRVLSGLLKNDYDVITAASGNEMISILRERAKSISVILLDLMMPDMDGFQAMRMIREHAIYRQIPIIVATGLMDEESQAKALSLGANGYVLKPYNRDILLHLIENTINLREKSALANALRRDALTGIDNRTTFLSNVERLVLRKDPGYYILSCFDIENFKIINDQYGTEKGDEILRRTAEVIDRAMLSIGGICCRYTADRFGMLYPAKHRDSEVVTSLQDQVIASDPLSYNMRIRIGRYLIDDLAIPVSAMYDRATLAEESIRGRYDTHVANYDEAMRESIIREQRIVNDMDEALAAGEFEPWFQPQYNHATGALIGAEALARWRKGDSYLSPMEFIPVFERNGFIYEMDQYIWEEVCKLLRRWIDEDRNPLPISVNVSRRDLLHERFIETLTSLVEKYGIPHDLFRLEVTESAFAGAGRQIISKVNELIDLGFVVEIDDFGSGYSSLNTLKDVPASILKLDMRFFENTHDQQRSGNIVESVIRMAKWLSMAVIAEGVEEKDQADYLRSIGCCYIQGFYYAKPTTASEYEKLLDASAKEPKLNRLQTLVTLDNSEFWNPKSMDTLIFNSYVGGACIFEYHNGRAELLRANEQYVRELGSLLPEDVQFKDVSLTQFLDQEELDSLMSTIRKAIDEEQEVSCEVRLSDGSQVEHVRVAVRPIAHAEERLLLYCVILNVTEQREAQRRRLERARQIEAVIGGVGSGVSVIQVHDDATSTRIFCSDRYFELYGYAKEQVEAEQPDVLSLILPEDVPTVLKKVRGLRVGGAPTTIDFCARRRDGALASLRANAALVHQDGVGNVVASVVTEAIGEPSARERAF